MRLHPVPTCLLLALALSACGTRGPLTLPPPQAKAPIGSPQPDETTVNLSMAKVLA